MDQTYKAAIEESRQARRESHAAEIHDAAHPEPVMGCEECDLRYLDSLSLDAVGTLLDTSIADAKR